MALWGRKSDEDEEGDGKQSRRDAPDKERREQIRDILNDYSVESFSSEGYETEFGRISSREYQEYQRSEEKRHHKNWYIRLVEKLGFYSISLGETQEKIDDATDLLVWEFDTTKIFMAAIMSAFITFFVAIGIFVVDAALQLNIPLIFKVGGLITPLLALYYVVQYPILQVQRKVINASDELILSLLYMVIYMRNSPNIEGAVRFAALNTKGPISHDLKRVLWETEVGNYTTVEESLTTYAKKWRPYNKDFIQSIELLIEATAEADPQRREQILAEAINNLLDGTREKMKRYARELRMPVSATFGIGILLPVLGMILFPLVASFMGGENLEVYLSFMYNVFLPVVLYIVIYHTLMRRPPTVATQNVESDLLPKQGRYKVTILDRSFDLPAVIPALIVFFVLGSWSLLYYFNVATGNTPLPPNAEAGVEVNTFTMFRSLMLTIAMSISLGVYLYLGNVQRIRKLREIGEMEQEFPEALFQLGNTLGRGNPIETGIRRAIGNMRQLSIAEMFKIMSYNMNEIGMTFEQSIFDEEYGALRHYPSKLIESVMRALNKSAEKGTRIVSKAMMSISTYLKNIYRTEEEIEEQLSETLATMSFLAFILAPVISGVALGLGTIITKAFYQLEQIQSGITGDVNTTSDLASGPTQTLAGGEGLGAFNVENAVPPDILQLVIGIYLIELSLLIGMFYVRLTEGENPIIQKMFTGKVLIVTPILYAITTLLLVFIFGSMISGALAQVAT